MHNILLLFFINHYHTAQVKYYNVRHIYTSIIIIICRNNNRLIAKRQIPVFNIPLGIIVLDSAAIYLGYETLREFYFMNFFFTNRIIQ